MRCSSIQQKELKAVLKYVRPPTRKLRHVRCLVLKDDSGKLLSVFELFIVCLKCVLSKIVRLQLLSETQNKFRRHTPSVGSVKPREKNVSYTLKRLVALLRNLLLLALHLERDL